MPLPLGDLDPDGYLAVTCNWNEFISRFGWRRNESDIRFNKADHTWTTGSCSGQFADAVFIEGLMTHEGGHTWNVPDFPNGHPELTMGVQTAFVQGLIRSSQLGLATCSLSKRSTEDMVRWQRRGDRR